MNSTANVLGWAPEPPGRGTTGLLWSCFATISLGTWSAFHPNLPGLNDSKLRIFLRRTMYILMCLGAPEGTAITAIHKSLSARAIRKELKANGVTWSLKKCFFLNMGGFVIQSKQDNDELNPPQRVSPKKLLELLQAGSIAWPELTDDEIDDRSKANWLVKALALFQIVWFITQVIGRWAQGLAVTTLELFTLGIILCAIIMFWAFWEKPYDIQTAVVLQVADAVPEGDCINRVKIADGFADLTICSIFFLVSLVFGATHIVAWNFSFPSYVEQVLWRVCSIVVIGTTCFFSVVLFLEGEDNSFAEDVTENLSLNMIAKGIIYMGFPCIYFIARLYIFVEMLVSLRAVPASVYETPQWSQYFPAFG